MRISKQNSVEMIPHSLVLQLNTIEKGNVLVTPPNAFLDSKSAQYAAIFSFRNMRNCEFTQK